MTITSQQVSWSYIKTTLSQIIQKVVDGKFLDPKLPSADIKAFYDNIVKEIDEAFLMITDA